MLHECVIGLVLAEAHIPAAMLAFSKFWYDVRSHAE